jgi:hypothetical protein
MAKASSSPYQGYYCPCLIVCHGLSEFVIFSEIRQIKTDAIVASVISRFGAAFRIRTEDLLITKALGRDAVALHSVPFRAFLPAGCGFHLPFVFLCVSKRFSNSGTIGENLSRKISRHRKRQSPKPVKA